MARSGALVACFIGCTAAMGGAVVAVACVGDDPASAISPSDAQAGGGGDAGGCEAGIPCNGACVPVDRNNCGACGKACAVDQVCDHGTCSATCSDPLSRCDAPEGGPPDCFDLRNDPKNCGACGQVCAVDTCVERDCARRVFVTNTAGNGYYPGAADICTGAAKDANLTGTFLPWLKRRLPDGGTYEPATQFVQSRAPYVRLDGVVVARSWKDLIDGILENPIAVTELKLTVPSPTTVWTAVGVTGQATPDDCAGWIAGSGYVATTGSTDKTDSRWTNGGTTNCYNNTAHVYCFEK
jgi:hypothetical protein